MGKLNTSFVFKEFKMSTNKIKCLVLALLLLASVFLLIRPRKTEAFGSTFSPMIPRVWDDAEMAVLQLPLVDSTASPKQISSDYYYRIPIRTIYKNYPVYAPGKEPAGYLDWLKQQDPESAFDAGALKTETDWIRAGQLVFESPISYGDIAQIADVRDPRWYEKLRVPATKEGTLPWLRYVIREKGKVELGTISCATCHTRVLPDGTVVKGAQGNFPFERAAALTVNNFTIDGLLRFERSFFGAPWIKPDPLADIQKLSLEKLAEMHSAIPPGVIARHGTNPQFPPQVPDLIGIKDRKYLDHTGLQLHRSVVDMMRYAALNQGADNLANYGGFIPGTKDFRSLPDPQKLLRNSDEQLYALALYIYSLKPPPNPNKFDRLAARGQKVFKREGCAVCHTPPQYTRNALVAVDGFEVPEGHRHRYDILWASIETDPRLALQTRRGTGYYKVPSLKGVWYRGPFEHNGSIATLEDWFDARRLDDDYVPTGFRGVGVKVRAIKGHRFGLDLSPADRQALISFLKTL
jgi:alkylated DNA nucleotide flippase Atl1